LKSYGKTCKLVNVRGPIIAIGIGDEISSVSKHAELCMITYIGLYSLPIRAGLEKPMFISNFLGF